jgi:hypothetical protein
VSAATAEKTNKKRNGNTPTTKKLKPLCPLIFSSREKKTKESKKRKMFTIAIEMTILYGGLGHGTDTKKKAVCASGCSASFPLSILDTMLVFLISRRYYYYLFLFLLFAYFRLTMMRPAKKVRF